MKVTNDDLGEYFGLTEGAIRALRKKGDENSKRKYEAMLSSYRDYIATETLSDNPCVIMLYGFKGGIGKSALARIINEYLMKHKSVLLNVDISRDVKRYTPLEAINFVDILEDDPDQDIEGFIDLLKEVANFVIIDTPGEISNHEVLASIKKTDLFILPYGVDEEEMDQVVMTVKSTLLADIDYEGEPLYPANKSMNMMFVLNDYKDEDDLRYIDKMKVRIDEVIDDSECEYPKINTSYASLKYSKAITTMSRKKKTLKSLGAENLVAYRVAKERTRILMKNVKKAIKKSQKEA